MGYTVAISPVNIAMKDSPKSVLELRLVTNVQMHNANPITAHAEYGKNDGSLSSVTQNTLLSIKIKRYPPSYQHVYSLCLFALAKLLGQHKSRHREQH